MKLHANAALSLNRAANSQGGWSRGLDADAGGGPSSSRPAHTSFPPRPDSRHVQSVLIRELDRAINKCR